MSTHNLCFKQIYEKYQNILPENFQFLEVKFSIYLNRRVFVMCRNCCAPAHYYIVNFLCVWRKNNIDRPDTIWLVIALQLLNLNMNHDKFTVPPSKRFVTDKILLGIIKISFSVSVLFFQMFTVILQPKKGSNLCTFYGTLEILKKKNSILFLFLHYQWF